MQTLKQRYDRLIVKAKGRKRAIKQLNSFVKHMHRNDEHLTTANETLLIIIDKLNKENRELATKLEEVRTYADH